MTGKAKKAMTLPEAAKTWIETKQQLQELEPKLKAAAAVLKEYFRRTGRSRRGRISYALTTYRSLDQATLEEEVGIEAVERCKVQRERETLSLLDEKR